LPDSLRLHTYAITENDRFPNAYKDVPSGAAACWAWQGSFGFCTSLSELLPAASAFGSIFALRHGDAQRLNSAAAEGGPLE